MTLRISDHLATLALAPNCPSRTALSPRYEVVVTTHAGHARDLLESEPDLARWRAVVAVSGDGLVNEIYSGLYRRRTGRGRKQGSKCCQPTDLSLS